MYLVKLGVVDAEAAGQVQEQLQQSLLGKGDLNTGLPGYQFWKARGSPLAHLVQLKSVVELVLLLAVQVKFLRRPIQEAEEILLAIQWLLLGVTVTRSLKQT